MNHYPGSVPTTPRAADWRDAAACRTEDPELFFASEHNPKSVNEARRICRACPSRPACLTTAYTDDDQWGIHAGLTPRQRNANLRKADGNVARAVAEGIGDATVLLRHLYQQHTQPTADGHLLWTDTRHFISVRGKPYTVHQLAFLACYGSWPQGHVTRVCDREGCVAKACLTDRHMRDRKKATA